MHSYSVKKFELKIESNFIPLDLLIMEIKKKLYKDPYLNQKSDKKRFHKILERKYKPPPYFRNLTDFINS